MRRRPGSVTPGARRQQPPPTATMNLYAHDLTLLDFNLNFSDQVFDPFTRPSQFSASPHSISAAGDPPRPNSSPPKYRRDGSSPLPFGMEWSTPPRKWVCLILILTFSFPCLVSWGSRERRAGVSELVKRGI